MAVRELTDDALVLLDWPVDKPQAYHWDAVVPGFGVVIGKTGRKTFVVRYRVDGKLSKTTIGAAGEPRADGVVWNVENARAEASRILASSKQAARKRGEGTVRPKGGKFEAFAMAFPCASACNHKECAKGHKRKVYVGLFDTEAEALLASRGSYQALRIPEGRPVRLRITAMYRNGAEREMGECALNVDGLTSFTVDNEEHIVFIAKVPREETTPEVVFEAVDEELPF